MEILFIYQIISKFIYKFLIVLKIFLKKFGILNVFNRENIAIIGIFKIVGIPNSTILFSNTHLVFNVKRGDIKLGQIYQLTRALEELRKKYEDELKNKVYIILASDLNCIPKSGVYKLLTKGELNCNQVNKIIISGQDLENLQHVEQPTKIRSYLLTKITPIFKEEKPKKRLMNNFNIKEYNNDNTEGLPSHENVLWFNEICDIKLIWIFV